MSELRFDDRVAVVTGAGAGLGRSHAHLLASRGAAVVVNDLDPAAADAAAAEITAAGGRATAFAADVSGAAGADHLVAAALDRFGRVDVVVNNAGALRAADFGEMTTDAFGFMIAVNLSTAYHVTRAAWPHLAAQRYGRIVSTTSNSGLLGTAGSSAYGAAKAALWGLTRCLALEGGPLDIHVNAIAPIAYTALSRSSRVAPESWRSGTGDAWSARLAVEQVSPAMAWLAHADCSINGQVWTVAGGRVGRFVLGVTEGFDDDALTIEQVRDREDEIVDAGTTFEYGSGGEEGKALHRRLVRRDRT